MNIVIDSNILFSILIKPDGKTSTLFESLKSSHIFYLSDASFKEINKHQNKLIKVSKLSVDNFEKLKITLISQLTIIPSTFITKEAIIDAYHFVSGIDIDDLPFVAASIFIDGYLWSGDKVLYRGLINRGVKKIFNSTTILMLVD